MYNWLYMGLFVCNFEIMALALLHMQMYVYFYYTVLVMAHSIRATELTTCIEKYMFYLVFC